MVWCQAQIRSWSATSRPSQSARTRCQVGDDLDAAADHRRVHRVVVAVQAHVVVTRQPRRGPPPGRRRDRRQRRASPARSAAIRSVGAQPSARRGRVLTSASHCCSWALKSAGPVKRAAGQERALQVVVGPLDQALGLRVGRLADQHLRRQRAAERLALRGELDPAAAPAADRALAVPDQHPRHRARAPRSAATSRRTGPAAARVGISTADSQRE